MVIDTLRQRFLPFLHWNIGQIVSIIFVVKRVNPFNQWKNASYCFTLRQFSLQISSSGQTNMEKHNKGTRWDGHATASYPILCSNTGRRSDYNQTYLPITFRSLSKILLKWGRLSGSSSQHCVIRDWSSSLQAFASTTGRNGGSSCAVTRAIISVDRKSDNHWHCSFYYWCSNINCEYMYQAPKSNGESEWASRVPAMIKDCW